MERGTARRARGAHPRARGAVSALSHAHAGGRLRAGTASEPALFDLEGVAASRGGRRVLHGVSLAIEPGATALLGPSGSGKSTLLRLLNRLADPDEGVVRFHGEELRDLDVLRLRTRVCLVPQLPAPLPGTVEDNVRYGPALRGQRADVERALRLAGLDPAYAARTAERLSVGEQQRVMLARALALEPEVLLLDEPTAALDERTRAGVEETLRRLVEELAVSTVLVTHDHEQARRLANRVLEIRDGRVAAGEGGDRPTAAEPAGAGAGAGPGAGARPGPGSSVGAATDPRRPRGPSAEAAEPPR